MSNEFSAAPTPAYPAIHPDDALSTMKAVKAALEALQTASRTEVKTLTREQADAASTQTSSEDHAIQSLTTPGGRHGSILVERRTLSRFGQP